MLFSWLFPFSTSAFLNAVRPIKLLPLLQLFPQLFDFFTKRTNRLFNALVLFGDSPIVFQLHLRLETFKSAVAAELPVLIVAECSGCSAAGEFISTAQRDGDLDLFIVAQHG